MVKINHTNTKSKLDDSKESQINSKDDGNKSKRINFIERNKRMIRNIKPSKDE